MRARLLLGISFAVCMVAACGGAEESASDDGAGGGIGSAETDGGTSIGIGPTDASAFFDGGVTVIADAGFGGDGGAHHRRDGGVGGFDGGVGVFDGGIFVDDAGVSPPPPPEDDGGSVGPRDASLSGPLLHDANGVVLGEIVSIQSEGAVFTIVTSNDYVIDINYDGTFPDQAFAYSGVNCAGTVYISTGFSSPLLGNTAYYSTTRGSFLIPAGPITDGAETSIPIDASAHGDPCVNGTIVGEYGWQLAETTAANIGLPDVIAAPLSYP